MLHGIDALPVEVEIDCDIRNSETKSMVVGLPDLAVKESIERVKSALANSGFTFPGGRVLINLAPAEVKKEGPLYDLPIAVGLLLAQGVLSPVRVRKDLERAMSPAATASPGHAAKGAGAGATKGADRSGPNGPGAGSGLRDEGLDARDLVFAGELALDGRLRPVKGVIAMAAMAKARGARGVVVPKENAAEAAVVVGIEAIGVSTLAEVVGLLTGHLEAQPHAPVDVVGLLRTAEAPIDFADVRGQEAVKRALVVAAAGGHNIIMLGPAGTGKTMMARALAGILPALTPDEALEVTRIYSAAGAMPSGDQQRGLVTTRPVRSPHHTASGPAIVGGGAVPRPGEISLAHHGVLFLDELPEFPRDVLETLRQPLEERSVTIARSHSAVKFPANFMLVAAMNPTPKGDMPADEVGRRAMDRYLAKISGPLIDRIDIHVEAPAVPFKQLSGAPKGTSSAQMRDMVNTARARQIARRVSGGLPNARLTGKMLDQLAPFSPDAHQMLAQAMGELGLSARAYDKIRRVARTIADLDGSESIEAAHVAEAVSYRLLDRKV